MLFSLWVSLIWGEAIKDLYPDGVMSLSFTSPPSTDYFLVLVLLLICFLCHTWVRNIEDNQLPWLWLWSGWPNKINQVLFDRNQFDVMFLELLVTWNCLSKLIIISLKFILMSVKRETTRYFKLYSSKTKSYTMLQKK